MDKVAIYIRLSKEDADKGEKESESVQNQRAILHSHALSQGWEIYDFYVDEDWSGSDRGRPEFHRLISDAEAGKFNIVLVKTQSRFARDSKYIEDYVHELFRDKGIRFVSLVDNIDTMQAGSKLSSRVHALLDEEQLDLLSSNIRRSFDEKAKEGQFYGSLPPYGYKKDPADHNHLIVDDEAASVVRLIFEMTAEGHTYMSIAQTLNSRGYPTPSNYKRQQGYKVDNMYNHRMNLGKWTRDTIRAIIANDVYVGTITNHKSTVVNFRTKKKRNLPRSRHVKCENMHEPIIDAELWERVQELRKNRRRASNGKNGTKHPLSSKVFCETCGSKMYKCKSGGIAYFRCYSASATGECSNHKRIRLDELEALVADKINEVLRLYANGDYLRENVVLTNRFEKRINDCRRQKAELEKAAESNRSRLKKLLAAFTDGAIERSIYEEVQSDYLREKEDFQNRLAALDGEIAELEKSVLAHEDKEAVLQRYTHIDKLTIPIVQEFIDSIIVGEVTDTNEPRRIVINMAV